MTPPQEKGEAINHAALVAVAAGWLKRKCAVVLTELVSSGEVPDAIGWRGTGSTLIECKVSKADFAADRRKFFRANPWQGIGQRRYFLTLPGITTAEQLPPKWGLLELTSHGVRTVREAELFDEVNSRHEIGILLSTLRRIGRDAPSGVSIRCYTIATKSRAILSFSPAPMAEVGGEA